MSDGIKRRDFLKVLGVTGAGAGLTGCSTGEVEKLLPYVVPPEDITPGVATWYTTVCRECAAECGMWVRSREGRVVKVEGNPSHAVSGGSLCARGHSAIQGLYSPDRFSTPRVRDNGTLRDATWEEAEALLRERIAGSAGNVLLLTGRLGPTERDLFTRFLATVGGRHVEHDGLSEAPLREATRIAFGRDVVPHYDFAAARTIVSFGADFLETWVSPVEYGRGFARASGADDQGGKGKFVFVGARLSLTGQNADEWLPIPVGAEAQVALAMASHVAVRGGDAGPYASLLSQYTPDTVAGTTGIDAGRIRELADAFTAAPSVAVGPGMAGHHLGATAANVAVHILNAVAGNVGRTLHLDSTVASAAARPFSEVQAAVREMAGGNVGVAIVRGTNPAHTLPASSGFAEAFSAVPFKVAFACEPDETTALADLILPERHFLESWGDSSPRPGHYAVQQPAMRPVPHFDTRQAGDVLLAVAEAMGSPLGSASTYDHVRARWTDLHARSGSALDFEAWWKTALKAGHAVVGAPPVEEAVPLRSPDVALAFDSPALDGDGDLALLVYPSSRLADGRHANRPWMQELPDPVSKLAWHAWVEMNPRTAEARGLRRGDVVTVTSPHGQVTLPLFTYPGIREDAVAIAMGGGRTESGRYANGFGVNPLALLPAVAEQPSGALALVSTRVTVAPTGERYRMATIEGADTQHDRNIAPAVAQAALGHAGTDAGDASDEGGHHGLQEMNLMGGFVPVETGGAAEDFPLPGSQYGDYGREGTPRWAMAIDLDKCTGCSACVVACQSENNVAFVGEQQVAMGRDLAWIRIERYYEQVDATHAGPVDVRHLPMLCQHCGNAPCEPVCPVFAAYHTPDGLNGQVYNRCVGTRYCANNCPYKVRVYNWYTYADVPEPLHWSYNPDVTVRNTGVMEKCSFCVQRIREVQNRAALEGGRAVQDGEVVPACQQSCPAEAIVFGNIKDPESRVAHLAHHERTYRVLDELINTQPAVHYLKKVTFHEVASADH
ncbi:MAG: 4Fe-4S dicluster domain-containing protein [Longimicrobiales bacterium]|nr:4Fe-4S dicluster domain-containing protein [Longimicrobiales bacterium]